MPPERLQKYLAHAGVASRRAAEEMILAGRIMVNGQVVRELGVKIDPDRDTVKVDGRRVRTEPLVTVMLHKPYGYLSTTKDPQARRVVMDLLGQKGPRLYPVGRLDYDATGLLLLTNDGELAQRLTHPRYQVPKTYRVTVTGEVSRETLRQLAEGVEVEGRVTPTDVKVRKQEAEKTVLEITVWEGRYHLIKRLLAQVGHPVLKIKRIAFGPLKLGRLARGTHRFLTPEEMAALTGGMGRK